MIESVENAKIKYLKKLKMKKYIDEEGKFLVEGFHLASEAVKKGVVTELIVLQDVEISFDGKKTIVSERVMKSLSSLESIPQVIAVCSKLEESELTGRKIVIMDGVQDPGNAGTIIRNAVAFNVDTVIFGTDSVSVYNDKVVRSSQGMIFNINIITGDVKDIIKELKNKGIKIYGTSLENAEELSTIEKTEEYAVVFGNEGSGVKKEILSLCDGFINIEMNDKCESVNVAVASGIILYHLR